MFWRFGFHNASAIDSLLDKENVQLEAILDEDDLLQECKAQNTRLIDYFQRVDVLQRLFAYVTGQIESEEKGHFKYPYVATEVLCSEIWSIVETCVNEQTQLLLPFWETVLDRSPDDMKTQISMAAHFAKINSVFLTKKPTEIFAFIRSQPDVIERLLVHIEAQPVVDLLVRIVQLDEQPIGAGVLEWLSSENLMGRLIELLAPSHMSDVHAVVSDLIRGIISMATPSPGAGLSEGLQNGSASNWFARELARRANVDKLTSYMLVDFSVPSVPKEGDEKELEEEPLPNFKSYVSSVVQSICMILELIRKNNSDFFEPYLFHTLRNRLIQVQQQQLPEGDREALEKAMKEMVDRMRMVHLGPVLEIMIPNLETLKNFLLHPRSVNAPISTTVGSIMPLSFERYRISELFAELLHCSNMGLLNRPTEADRLYDSEGRLQGGLSALEELAQVISQNAGNDVGNRDVMDESQDAVEPALELPITHGHDSLSMDSDEYMSDDDEPGSSDDDAMEEIAMYDESQMPLEISSSVKLDSPALSSSPTATLSLPSPSDSVTQIHDLNSSTPSLRLSKKTSRRTNTLTEPVDRPLPVGERLKKRYLEINILTTLMDLFFEFPWNNFLHSAVYDIIHQILMGRVDNGFNRELAISLFRDVRLMHRIVDGQKRSDAEASKPNGVRLGYMGHLTLISEDVLTALERFPPDLRLLFIEYAPIPGWDEYVTGRYDETRKKDTRVLGGGKPVVGAEGTVTRHLMRWKVDEDDGLGVEEDTGTGGSSGGAGGIKSEGSGEFRRSGSTRLTRESSADFGPPSVSEEEDEESHAAPQFARYLAREMHSSDIMGSSGSDDEDSEEEGGWLSQSTFCLAPPPLSARHRAANAERRPLSSLSTGGFDDSFGASSPPAHVTTDNPFNPTIEDGFGPFSDPVAVGGTDPFTFSSSFSDEIEDSSFDSTFGDFGEFQSAGDGDLTPTTGSWTFASDSSASDEGGSESGLSEERVGLSPRGGEIRGL